MADKLFWKPLVGGGPPGNSTWQEQGALPVGHLTAVHDAMLPLLGLRERNFILSLMSPLSRIPTGREPTFLRTTGSRCMECRECRIVEGV